MINVTSKVVYGKTNEMRVVGIFEELFGDLYVSSMTNRLDRVEISRYPGNDLEMFELVFDGEIVYELTVRVLSDGSEKRDLQYVGDWSEDALYNVLRDYIVDEYEKELDNLT